jgi:phosphoesterase RecJ-like protein
MALTQNQQLYELLQMSENPLIIFRPDHNGDMIAASLALANLLQKLGRNAEIVSPNFILPNIYSFLPEAEKIKGETPVLKNFRVSLKIKDQQHPQIDYKVDADQLHIFVSPARPDFSREDIKISPPIFRHNLIISVNTPDLDSLGELYRSNTDFFYQTPIVNIDHLPENEHYGHINFINLAASSVSEIIYDFIEQTDSNLLDEKLATYLLAGMIEKTKSFKMPNVTPKSLNIASQLMAAGAERETIVKNLYQTRTVGALRLWGRILLNLKTDDLQKIAWAVVSENDFIETNALTQDLFGVIDELIVSIPTIEMTALFYEKNNERFCLLKSEKNLNLRGHFAEFAPSGNTNLIKFALTAEPAAILEKLKQLV